MAKENNNKAMESNGNSGAPAGKQNEDEASRKAKQDKSRKGGRGSVRK